MTRERWLLLGIALVMLLFWVGHLSAASAVCRDKGGVIVQGIGEFVCVERKR